MQHNAHVRRLILFCLGEHMRLATSTLNSKIERDIAKQFVKFYSDLLAAFDSGLLD